MTIDATQKLNDMLKFDPLQAAEDLLGKSYKTNDDVTMLGLAISQIHNAQKNAALDQAGDSKFSNDLISYKHIISDIGFEQVLEIPFQVPGWNDSDPVRNEKFFAYAHRELGILLCFDTYSETRVNGGNFYYCWVPNSTVNVWSVTSSGGWRTSDDDTIRTSDDGIAYWEGSHDCREAIRFNINRLRENGKFLQKWPTASANRFIWLLHHGDTVGKYDYKAINAARLGLCPEWVQDFIGWSAEN